MFLVKQWNKKRAYKWGQGPEADPGRHRNNHHPTTGEYPAPSPHPCILFFFPSLNIYCFRPQENLNSSINSFRSIADQINVSRLNNTWECIDQSYFPLFLPVDHFLLLGSSREQWGRCWATWEQHKTSSTQIQHRSSGPWVEAQSHEFRRKSAACGLLMPEVGQSLSQRGARGVWAAGNWNNVLVRSTCRAHETHCLTIVWVFNCTYASFLAIKNWFFFRANLFI